MRDERHSGYCATQVRTYDRDRYLSALFAPADRRAALFALYAFNLEIAKTRETVSEALLGQMRLQWWRDTIHDLYRGNVRAHQVAEALAPVIARHGLTPALFERLIDAREFDLTDAPPEDIEALERYAEETAVPLNALALEILEAASADASRAARHAGIAYALTGVLRATPFLLRQGRCLLPRSLLRHEGVSFGRVSDPASRAGVASVVSAVAVRARAHVDEARRSRLAVPRNALPVLLPLALAAADLKKLERARFNVFDPRGANNPLSRQLRLSVAAMLKRF